MAATNLNKSARALIAALKAAERTQPDIVPAEWLRMGQIAAALGTSVADAKRRLHLVPHEVKMFRVRLESGGVRAVPHYRLAK
jgi:hypothetical protein